MQDKDKYLIIGGGIAGLSLAYRFLQNNVPFELITKEENHSSLIAAGLMIPIVFRRTTKSWNVDEFLPEAKVFYHDLEATLQQKLWHDIPVRRSFSHQQEADEWQSRMSTDSFKNYLGETNTSCPPNLYQEFGTGIVKNAAWIDTTILLSSMHSYLQEKRFLHYGDIDFSTIAEKKEQYKGIIFCEGYEMGKNPYFYHLPLDPTKGQVLVIHSEEIPEHESINRKCFVLPIGNHQFKVGSTYEWHDTSLNITNEAKEQLTHDLEALIDVNYAIVEQQAGVRPTVTDRRPLLGVHPEEPNLFVLNGFGTKGFLLAPTMSQKMYEFIISGKSLPEEVNITRFK